MAQINSTIYALELEPILPTSIDKSPDKDGDNSAFSEERMGVPSRFVTFCADIASETGQIIGINQNEVSKLLRQAKVAIYGGIAMGAGFVLQGISVWLR